MPETKEKRRKISNEEFLKLKEEMAYGSEASIFLYYVIVLKENDENGFKQIAKAAEIDENELKEQLSKELKINFEEITEEKFLEKFPEEQIALFKQLKEFILENKMDLAQLEKKMDTFEAYKELEKQRQKSIEKQCALISSLDLSRSSTRKFL
ncbi:MAG: hypothetical protein K6B70_05955 [Clostridia bacterium]|nr:hypothetical protein [Clostridia bacterium]